MILPSVLDASDARSAPHAPSCPDLDPDAADTARWLALLTQVGQESAEPLSAALERVTSMATTGQIDRRGIRALRDEIARARQAGIWSQQIARLASGRIRQSHERVHLTHTVQSALAYRARELHSQGVQLTQALHPVEVQSDASMLFGLLNALVDWWLHAAQGRVVLQIDTQPWPAQARMFCRVQHQPADQASPPPLDGHCPRLDSLEWRLLEQYARTMRLSLERRIGLSHVEVTLGFPLLPPPTLEDALADDRFVDSVNSKPLAGSHVLVVAARRDLRVRIRESLQSMGLVLDFATSVQDAIDFCSEGLPHALVFDGSLRSPNLEQLVNSIRQEVPEFVFIELVDGARHFDMSTSASQGLALVGRDVAETALPSALVYELSRWM